MLATCAPMDWSTVAEALALALALALLFRASQFLAYLPGGVLNIVHPEVSLKEAEQQMEKAELSND